MDPFAYIPIDRRPQILSMAALASIACMATLYWIGPTSNLAKAVECTTSQVDVENIVSTFGPHGRSRVVLNLGIDFLFIAAYVMGIGLACLAFLKNDPPGTFRTIGYTAASAAYIAGAADVFENLGLLLTLLWRFHHIVVAASRVATTVKWSAVGFGGAFILLAVGRIALSLTPVR